VAKADGEDIIIDQIINSLSAVDPTAALDLSSWLSSLDAALQGAANFDPSSLDGILDPSTWAGALDPSTVFDPSSVAGALDPSSVFDPSSVVGALDPSSVVDPSAVIRATPDIDSALSAASSSAADPAALPA